VRRACQQLGHAVALSSAPGRGSRFRVRLPLMRGAWLPEEAPEAVRQVPGADLTGRRVLVVENDRSMREAFGMLLRSWGMEVVSAAGLAEASATAGDGGAFDLVLTDYRLDGDETGAQVIEAMRRDLGAAVPALIVSAEAAEAVRRLAEPLGVPVLEKPVAEAELRRAVEELLEGTA